MLGGGGRGRRNGGLDGGSGAAETLMEVSDMSSISSLNSGFDLKIGAYIR